MTATIRDIIDHGQDIAIQVRGKPIPQGSKNVHHAEGRRPWLTDVNKNLPAWRNQVAAAAQQVIKAPLTGPVHVRIVFWLPRPKGHFGTGRNALKVKPGAPALPDRMPDIDKLARSTLDAMTAIVYEDDSRVTELLVRKRYDNAGAIGCDIWIGRDKP